jgi:hypothetical protein
VIEFPPAGSSEDERIALEERAAIMEFDGGLTREAAEAAALKLQLEADARASNPREKRQRENLAQWEAELDLERRSSTTK